MKTIWQSLQTLIMWLILLAGLIVMVAMYTNFNSWLVQPLVRDEEPTNADVIIILGGGVNIDLKILPWGVQERMQTGINLFKEGRANKIIVAGGIVEGQNYSESEFMREYAEFLGVPSTAIYEESLSINTLENAINSFYIMNAYEWETALVVTSYFHTFRACRFFERTGADITCIAAFPSEGFDNNSFRKLIEFRSIVRDYAATAYYYIKGDL